MTPADIKYIVVHCSRTTARQGDGFATVERKCRLRGALSCGYHYVISRDGLVQTGRRPDEPGNHLIGHNDRSLGVCLVGMPGKATAEQKRALETLLDTLKEQFPEAQPITHEELQPRTGRGCPGLKLKGV